MTEHRVSMLGNSLRRYEDPTRSRDPQVVALLDALSRVEMAPPPRAHFRAELRAQLVAVTPRFVSEGMSEASTMVDIVPRPKPAQLRSAATGRPMPYRPAAVTAPRASSTFWDKVRAIPIMRPLGVAAAVITVFTLLLGGAVWMSQDSVPGDSLYGLKRASEKFELYTDSSDNAMAQDHLDFAGRRIDEARILLERHKFSASGSGIVAAGGLSKATVDQIMSALRSADADTQSASRLLGDEAVSSASTAPLATMTNWAPIQLAKLEKLHAALPSDDPGLAEQAKTSSSVVHQAATRATALGKKVDCACMGKVRKDKLGPVPCTRCERATTNPPATPRTAAPTTRTTAPTKPAPTTTSTPSRTVVVPPPTSLTPASGHNGGASTTKPRPILPIPGLPGLPTIVPKAPITLSSTCVSVLDLLKIGCQVP